MEEYAEQLLRQAARLTIRADECRDRYYATGQTKHLDDAARLDKMREEVTYMYELETEFPEQEPVTKTATLLKANLPGYRGIAALYGVTPPLDGYEFVVVSSVLVECPIDERGTLTIIPETYIFGATQFGEVLDMGELTGSFRGGIDHIRALRSAGYVVIS